MVHPGGMQQCPGTPAAYSQVILEDPWQRTLGSWEVISHPGIANRQRPTTMRNFPTFIKGTALLFFKKKVHPPSLPIFIIYTSPPPPKKETPHGCGSWELFGRQVSRAGHF